MTRLRFLPLACAPFAPFAANPSSAQTPGRAGGLPSETPRKLAPANGGFDYARREAMIPMRDGVKLYAVTPVPRGAKGAPMLLTRTPDDASALTSRAESSHLGPILRGYDNATDVIAEGGYIRVVQDVRGKDGSGGDYVMNRPLRWPLNPTQVDHATGTYDAIERLVKNTPESNGEAGITGISYDGFLPLMALVDPHPAPKASVPTSPMVDGRRGDDWFHNGAFRQRGVPYVYDQEATRESGVKWWASHFDPYGMFVQAGSAGELGRLFDRTCASVVPAGPPHPSDSSATTHGCVNFLPVPSPRKCCRRCRRLI